MYEKNPNKIWTGFRAQFAHATSVLNKIMMHAPASEFAGYVMKSNDYKADCV